MNEYQRMFKVAYQNADNVVIYSAVFDAVIILCYLIVRVLSKKGRKDD